MASICSHGCTKIMKRAPLNMNVISGLLLLLCTQSLFLVFPLAAAWHLEILVTSPWRNEERRNILRNALTNCKTVGVATQHKVTYHFFMGNVNDTRPSFEEDTNRVLFAAGRFLENGETLSSIGPAVEENQNDLGVNTGEHQQFSDAVVTTDDEAFLYGLRVRTNPADTSSPEIVQRTHLLQGDNNYRDLVVLNGPDLDPPVQRDVTYVLERPTSRAFRVAYGTRWVYLYLPSTDFIFYLDDDSFLNVPRLFQLLDGVAVTEQRNMMERQENGDENLSLRYRNERDRMQSIVVGYMMATDVDMGRYDVCEMCDPCERCLNDRALKNFCAQLPHLSLGGCLAYMNTCKIYGTETPLLDCIRDAQMEAARLAEYFGTKKSPLWLLGMGWLFGKRVINWIARNAADLKKRGAADLILGYWLVGMEDLNWVDTGPYGNFRFHDYPMRGNTFTRACHDETILVHRMTPKRWERDFDRETCSLDCALETDPELSDEDRQKIQEEEEKEERRKELEMADSLRELELNPTGVKRETRIRDDDGKAPTGGEGGPGGGSHSSNLPLNLHMEAEGEIDMEAEGEQQMGAEDEHIGQSAEVDEIDFMSEKLDDSLDDAFVTQEDESDHDENFYPEPSSYEENDENVKTIENNEL
ncbi:unnamed protein product, partial [Amoebophrya sp. A120]|eukprot:GSA120T00023167001.1